MEYIDIPMIIFTGKRNIPWKDVEMYLSEYSGIYVKNANTGDRIKIGSRFASEYCFSSYTQKLHGTIEKAKANAAQIIQDLVRTATNRRWIVNKNEKHNADAKGGWYRYDVFFSMPISFAGNISRNCYRATMVVRINDSGLYLHDIVNIKKEDSKPFES